MLSAEGGLALPSERKQHGTSAACARPITIAVVLFPGFELLDVAAPGELLGATPGISLMYASEQAGLVPSSCMEIQGGDVGPSFVATHVLQPDGVISSTVSNESIRPDGILIPGGKGVRAEVNNSKLLEWLRSASERCEIVFTVCTGSWLLAASGGLDGRKATSNKSALRQGSPQSARPEVDWQMNARWIVDEVTRTAGRRTLYLTSSGVSAGGDAALALIARLHGAEVARRVAHNAEWNWHEDPTMDPFALAMGVCCNT